MAIATVQHDGVEVSSNTDSVEQLRTSLGVEAPPEPAVKAAEPDAAETDDAEKVPQARDDKGRFGPKVQKRIDTLTWEKNEAIRRAEAAERRAQEAEARVKPREPERLERAEPVNQPETTAKGWQRYKQLPGAPKLDDFDSIEDFHFAAAEFVSAQRDEERSQQAVKDAESRRLSEGYSTFETRGLAFAPDFVEVMTKAERDGLSFGPVLGPLVLTEEFGPQVGYELVTHPDMLRRLSQLDGEAARREFYRLIGKIEARHESASSSSRGSDSAAPISKAKAPLKPLEPAPVVDDAPPGEDADDEAYRLYMNRRELALRQRRSAR